MMNKLLGIVFPYIMIAFVSAMNFVVINEKLLIEGLVIGLLSGMWFIFLHKSEATKGMKIGMIVSLIVFAGGVVVYFLNLDIPILSVLAPVLAYLLAMECVGLSVVLKNKPYRSMSYQYSYKNKRRRYF